MMTCEACVGVAVESMILLSLTIFSCAGDRLAQKMSSYVESWEYVEVYNGVWSVLVCGSVVYDRGFPYDIFWRTLQAHLNRIP